MSMNFKVVTYDYELLDEVCVAIEEWAIYGCKENVCGFILSLLNKYNGTLYGFTQVEDYGNFLLDYLFYNPKTCGVERIAIDLIEYFELKKPKRSLMKRIIDYLKGK